MIRYFVHRGGRTELVDRLDPAWLLPAAAEASAAPDSVVVWADVAEPTEADGAILRDRFGLHELVVEAALQREPHPKVESYGRYLYIVLHGINFEPPSTHFETHETDFFLAPNFLVTVHDGQRRSIAQISEVCTRADTSSAKVPRRLLHRIVDTMVDHYRPEVEEARSSASTKSRERSSRPRRCLTGDILAVKRDITNLRRDRASHSATSSAGWRGGKSI